MGDNESGRCMYSGFCCGYTACDCKNIDFLCEYEEDCLCWRHSGCLSCDAKPKACGCATEEGRDECCKIGCYCVDCGIVMPKTLCASAIQCLCCYEVCSFPCSEDYVPKCVCAFLFCQCAPNFGCCQPPPDCPALDKLKAKAEEVEAMTMERGGDDKKEEDA